MTLPGGAAERLCFGDVERHNPPAAAEKTIGTASPRQFMPDKHRI